MKSPERDKAITLAALELGILLAREGDLNGARMAYRHAVDFGHTGTAPWLMVKLALALIEEDMETAQAALQSAVDTGHPPVVAVASLGLGDLLAQQGDGEAPRAAFQRAIDSGDPQIAAAAAPLELGRLLADRGDTAAARDAFHHAALSEYPPDRRGSGPGLAGTAASPPSESAAVGANTTPDPSQQDPFPADSPRTSNPVLQRTTDLTDVDEQVSTERPSDA